jgi:addiction module HigA family antidote
LPVFLWLEKTGFTCRPFEPNFFQPNQSMKRNSNLLVAGIFLAAALAFSGCATNSSLPASAGDKGHSESVILREGDVLKITFPGSPNLDVTQQIRRDGKITMALVGEIDAAGQTPDALQKKLIELYAPQISSKEVNVSVQSSSFPVFVNGSVIHPGEILLEDFMKPMGISARQLAADIDVSPSRISDLVNGNRPVTADTAVRLGLFFNMEPRFWLNLQTEYDMRVATRTLTNKIAPRIRIFQPSLAA